MKRLLFISILLICSFTQNLNAQIIAGSGYPGMIISDPGINLSNGTFGSSVWAYFDLDCDTIADMKIELYKGYTAIDGANYGYLYMLNSNFEIIADSIGLVNRLTTFFDSGDTLIPPVGASWSADSIFTFGNYGCMGCPGPASTTNKFLAYRNVITSQVGWINISLNLNDGGTFMPVTLSIPEILSPCVSTAFELDSIISGTCGIFTYTTEVNPTPCVEVCYGSIEVTSISGSPSPPYLFACNGGPFGSSSFLGGLCAGPAMLVFADALGNSCSISIDIPFLAPISFTTSITNISCSGLFDGSICIFPSGGEGTFVYSIDGGTTFQASPCFTGLSAGAYLICVNSPYGCQLCSTIVITEPDPVTISITEFPVTCNSACDGDVQFNVFGGTPPFSFVYIPLVFPSAGNFCAGSYVICTSDGKGCMVCSTAVVTEPDTLSIEVITNPVSCATCCDGDLQIIPSGGTPPYTTSYSVGTSTLPNNFCSGNYVFCVTDSNGCQVCYSAIIIYSLGIGSNENNNSQSIKPYPNPTTGKIYFEFSSALKNASVNIIDVTGQIILNQQNLSGSNFLFDVSAFANGIYFLEVKSEEGIERVKFVKN